MAKQRKNWLAELNDNHQKPLTGYYLIGLHFHHLAKLAS